MPIKLEVSAAEKHDGDAVCIAYSNNHIFSGGADGKIKVNKFILFQVKGHRN